MKTRTVYLVLAGLFCTTVSFAQTAQTTTPGGTTVGIRAGVNFTTIDDKSETINNDLLTGYHAGVNVEIPLASGFYLQPGAIFSTKGAQYSDKSKIRLNYIEVPVNFVYKPSLGSGNLILGFGPYAAWGVGGKVHYTTGDEYDIEFGGEFNPLNSYSLFERFDAGGNLLAGYEFANRFSVQLNAQLGMKDIYRGENSDNNTRWKNIGWGASLGFRL